MFSRGTAPPQRRAADVTPVAAWAGWQRKAQCGKQQLGREDDVFESSPRAVVPRKH